MAASSQHTQPAVDERWQLVHRILRNPAFARSPRLSEFLVYVCERAIDGRTDEISEQQIGVQVFKRTPGYNPNDDSIVRSHARLLRQRLDLYFKEDGKQEGLRVHIPKGRYVPLFEHRDVQPVHPHRASFASVSGIRISNRWVWLCSVVCAAALTVSAVVFWIRSESTGRSAAQSFWKMFFANGQRVVIVPADSALALLEDLTQRRVHLPEYLNGKYRFDINGKREWSRNILSGIASRQYTSMSDLNLAVRLVRRREASAGQVDIRYARNLQLSDLKQSSAVLIGGPRANPWEELFENKMNFEFATSGSVAPENVVINKVPRAGESSSYSPATTDLSGRAYGLLAYLPGLSPVTRVLIVEGTNAVGTESAADFLLDDLLLSTFLDQISRANRKVPYFEVLLETAMVGGNAQQPQIVAYRTIGK
jgi:hypothetical protein